MSENVNTLYYLLDNLIILTNSHLFTTLEN